MSFEYQQEDVRLRLLYGRSVGVTGATAIRERTGCTPDDAWRLSIVRDIASAVLLEQWQAGQLSWRRLWRLATDNPFDQGAQLRIATHGKGKSKKALLDATGPLPSSSR
ncbi:MAG: hypothetical protein M3O46_19945 [Myxococcota bacterium]|nr:hypothetical protein [Myxococcota bacterium]